MRPHRLVAMARWQSFGVGHFLLSLRALTDQPAQLHAPSLSPPSFSPQPSPLPPPSPSSSFSSSSCAKFILKKINVDFNKHIISRSSSLVSSSFFPLRSNLVSPGRIYIGSAALLSLSQYTGSTSTFACSLSSSTLLLLVTILLPPPLPKALEFSENSSFGHPIVPYMPQPVLYVTIYAESISHIFRHLPHDGGPISDNVSILLYF